LRRETLPERAEVRLILSLKTAVRLQALQVFAVALPVCIQLWLARTLGTFDYGRFVFVSALIASFVLFCDFGFNWSATRLIAVHRADARRCSELVSAALLAKGVLFLVGLLLLLLLVTIVDEFVKERQLLLLAYAGVLGAVLLPTWYFLGTERPHIALALDIGGRSLSLLCVIALVRSPRDLTLAVSVIAAGQLVVGIAGAVMLLREADLRWVWPGARGVASLLAQGTPLFLSTSAVTLYTAASGLVLGFVATREQVAYFGAAQRIITAGSTVLSPLQQLIYPRLSHRLHHEPQEARRDIKSALLVQGGVGLVISVATFAFANGLATLLFGPSFAPAARVLVWMAPVPLLVAVAGVFANYVMMALGKDRLHLTMTLTAAVLNLITLVPLAARYGSVGAGIALLLTECFVLVFAWSAGSRLVRALPEAAKA
jgi:O-antigen/teichoic acid export membrane protein